MIEFQMKIDPDARIGNFSDFEILVAFQLPKTSDSEGGDDGRRSWEAQYTDSWTPIDDDISYMSASYDISYGHDRTCQSTFALPYKLVFQCDLAILTAEVLVYRTDSTGK